VTESASTTEYLERYRAIAPAFDRLCEVTQKPQPRALWLNPLIEAPFDVGQRVLEREPNAEPVPYLPDTWRLPHDATPGRWPEYAAGIFHTQEESTLWPADVVGAQPGEKILDMCAAPGNKTLRMACAMNDSGVIVANEKNWPRLASLRYNLTRLGATSVITNCDDGCRIDARFGLFDRVLVDVPCTCEGTGRKSGGNIRPTTPKQRAIMSDVQTGLLRKAFEYVKPGGVVVYATCTYAPEENEGVLDRIYPDVATVEPLDVPKGIDIRPGIAEWEGHRYRSDVTNAARLWAHENDSGGFFVAKLRKVS
jgi:16S rRNA C967 or C1407 C5-methylase (RsmB/RsmF family)